MIAYLRGLVDTLTPTNAYIDCQGVGYNVNISLTTYTQLQSADSAQPVRLWITEIMRQDQFELYGFISVEEQMLFDRLITVSGVGAGTARVILSSYTAGELTDVIERGDVDRLKMVKGIGLKTAQRIILDLKGKLPTDPGDRDDMTAAVGSHSGRQVAEEALAALKMLGFAEANIRKVLKKIMSADPDAAVESVIKQALSQL